MHHCRRKHIWFQVHSYLHKYLLAFYSQLQTQSQENLKPGRCCLRFSE